MGTRKVVIKGKGYWMKVFEKNRDLTGFQDALKEKGGQTVMDIDLEPSEIEKLKRAKFMSAGKPSPDNEGMTRVRLKRKWTEQYAGGAPEVLKADGTPWDYEQDGSIGNGSTVGVVVEVYDTRASKQGIYGARLTAVKVLEHIPYTKDLFAGLDGDGEEFVEEEPAPKTSAKTKAPTKIDFEDSDIPF
jgi:hypothetical protein